MTSIDSRPIVLVSDYRVSLHASTPAVRGPLGTQGPVDDARAALGLERGRTVCVLINIGLQQGEQSMDFFERLFGWAPDGGSGILEFLLFVIPIAGIVYIADGRRKQRQRERDAASRRDDPSS